MPASRSPLISDHFHPWIDRQGQSPFVWTVLGAIAAATRRLGRRDRGDLPDDQDPSGDHRAGGRDGGGPDAGPLLPRALAPARTSTSTSSAQAGRAVEVRHGDAGGGRRGHPGALEGRRRTIAAATSPSRTPACTRCPSACRRSTSRRAAPKAADASGQIGDGLIATGPKTELVSAYREAGGDGPLFGQVTICWAASEREARRTVREWWPTVAIHGEASQELPLPVAFRGADLVRDRGAGRGVVSCGPDPEPHLARSATYLDAASIASTSTRSAPIRRASSTSPGASCFRRSSGARSRLAADLRP